MYGEGSVLSVNTELNTDVEALQEAIVKKKKDVNHRFCFDPATVTLYLAREVEGDEIKWLTDGASVDGFVSGKIDTAYDKMRTSWILGEDYLDANFQPWRKTIHVLVELPTQLMA